MMPRNAAHRGAELLAYCKSEGVLTSDPYCVQESAFQHVPVSEFVNYRFIVNLDENVYIDREKLPVACSRSAFADNSPGSGLPLRPPLAPQCSH